MKSHCPWAGQWDFLNHKCQSMLIKTNSSIIQNHRINISVNGQIQLNIQIFPIMQFSLSQAGNTLNPSHPLRVVSFMLHSLILLDSLPLLGKLFIARSNLVDSGQKTSHLDLDCCDRKFPPDLPSNQSQLITYLSHYPISLSRMFRLLDLFLVQIHPVLRN